MNERINELKLQCIFRETRGTDASNSYVVDRFDTEKFAELIVKATCNVILHYDNVDEGVAVAKKHFGVTE